MSVRPVWKGAINFGLVSINIELLKAVQSHAISFRVLHETCNAPVSNKRWCSQCDKEVEWEATVKGMKLDDGSYYVMSKESIQELKPEKTDTIDIVQFVDSDTVSPIYFDRHYYVVPQKKSDKAYFLFCAALAKYKQAAIGQFVMRYKDAVCLLQPYGDALLLTTLNYAYEIIPLQADTLNEVPKVTTKELELAHMLIKKLYKKEFTIKSFKDTFAARLSRALKRKKEGKIIKVKKPAPPKISKESLMDSLRASLEEYDGKATSRGR